MSAAFTTSTSPAVHPPLGIPHRARSIVSQTTAVTAPTLEAVHAPMTVPMGFAAQIRALQVAQREQAVRLATLEQENADLKAFKESAQDFFDRIDALEQQNTHLATRRRECVAQLLNLRTLHQEASNAFDLRAQDIQPDDLEETLTAYTTSITSVVNHHQRAIGALRSKHHVMPSYAPHVYALSAQYPNTPTQMSYPYPLLYNQWGYCRVHNAHYRCQICGQ
jgi:hypothetical protein